jgi:aryl-alcohol dehydrogenase-like predicted oxidoreductase
MDRRPLGRTGVQVSKLCRSTMMFGTRGVPDAVLDRIDAIVKPGMTIHPADTSSGEQLLAPVLRRR